MARKPRAAATAATVTETPTPQAAPAGVAVGRTANGRVVVVGRDGQELSRKRTITSDIFHIPPEIVPENWVYQWNVHDVLGQPQTSARLAMAENGWRPVPAERHPGYFMPEGYKGPIVRDGLILEERPKVLNDEAQAEELAKARRQVTDQIAQLQLGNALPAGFTRDNPDLQRVERAKTRQEYAPAPDIPRPRLEIDPQG